MHESSLVTGILLAALGGVFSGMFALPMKLMRKWKWEHIWLAYSLVGMVIVPWTFAIASTPQLGKVIAAAPLPLICGFGFCWGLGSVFFGLGLDRLGLGLGLALMMGIIAGVGSLVPLLVKHPEMLLQRQGLFILTGNAILIAGISFCAIAGSLRQKQQQAAAADRPRHSLISGFFIAIMAGLFSSMLNFSFAFSQDAQQRAVELGASSTMASMSVWALAVSAGFLVNLVYCLWLIRKSGWSPYRLPGTALYWLGALVMGILWFGQIVSYGIGASYLGASGPVVGWPILMGGTIVTSNVLGWITGEWKGTGSKCWTNLVFGILAIIIAMVVIAQGNA
jgi:L-rhamnose-H+ transport protein